MVMEVRFENVSADYQMGPIRSQLVLQRRLGSYNQDPLQQSSVILAQVNLVY